MTTVLTDTAPITIQPAAAGLDELIVTDVPAGAAIASEKAASEVSENLEEPSGFKNEGLRELTGQDWLYAAAWGIAGSLAATAVSVLFLPAQLMALTFILGAGLGILGYLDHCTQLIRNTHNIAFGIAAALILVATQVISPASAILLPAVIAAAASFAFMLGLAVYTQFAGGGDIKLSPIPAALLAAVSPIAAMLWLLFTFALCLAAMIAARLTGSKTKHVAMAPFMAVAAVLAIAVYGLLSHVLGI